MKAQSEKFDDGLIAKISDISDEMSRKPEFADYIAENKLAKLKEQFGKNEVSRSVDEFVRRKVNDMSDNIPNTSALDNKFYDKWLSDEKMGTEQVGTMLKQYRALTDTTRFAVATGYIASHGNTEQEKDYSQNLHEENGGSKGKAHIELLDDFAKSLMNLALGKNAGFELPAKDSDVFNSTKQAVKYQQDLYTGVTADEGGIKNSLLDGNHPKFVKSTIEAVTAAHEGKAPGMLMTMLLGSAKYIKDSEHPRKQTQISKLRKYFDEHLGQELVDGVIDGKVDSKGLKQAMIDENNKVRDLTSDECRDAGFVEQAHRKDANKALTETVINHDNDEDKMLAFVKAREAFDLFLQVQGQFWNGVQDGLDGKDVNASPKKAVAEHQRSQSMMEAVIVYDNSSNSGRKRASSLGSESEKTASNGNKEQASHVSALQKKRNEDLRAKGK